MLRSGESWPFSDAIGRCPACDCGFFTATDTAACIAVFDSNTPPFFAPRERAEFEAFLQENPQPYFVVENDDQAVVACGGIWYRSNAPVAAPTWGMVARHRHRQGVGRDLLIARLQKIWGNPAIVRVDWRTSQHVAAFFEKLGFATTEIVIDGYAKGLHRYSMSLSLDASRRHEILHGLHLAAIEPV